MTKWDMGKDRYIKCFITFFGKTITKGHQWAREDLGCPAGGRGNAG